MINTGPSIAFRLPERLKVTHSQVHIGNSFVKVERGLILGVMILHHVMWWGWAGEGWSRGESEGMMWAGFRSLRDLVTTESGRLKDADLGI